MDYLTLFGARGNAPLFAATRRRVSFAALRRAVASLFHREPIALSGVIEDHGSLFAVINDGHGRGNRIVPLEPAHLASFRAFRRRVRKYLGLRVSFAGDWGAAVASAYRRGAAA